MKLINFKFFEPLNKIEKRLDIKEYTKIDIGYKHSELALKAMKWDKIKFEGIEIKIEELNTNSDGTFSHPDFPDERVILYIKNTSGIHKYHLTWCSALRSMEKQGRMYRYAITRRVDGIFNTEYYGIKKEVKLDLCKYCISNLGYNPFKQPSLVTDFPIEDFLKNNKTDLSEYANNGKFSKNKWY